MWSTLRAVMSKKRAISKITSKNPEIAMTTGVIYTAIGPRYIDEAIQSANCAKKHMRDLSISIFSDQEINDSCFDECIVIPRTDNGYLAKIDCMSQSPYEYSLYLDTDTYICEDCQEIFYLLLKYEIAVVLAEHRTGEAGGISWDYQKLLDSKGRWMHPLANTGVVLYRKSSRVQTFLSAWHSLAKQEMANYGIAHTDQPAFLPTLHDSDIREAILPPEFNCRFIYPQGICGTVKILHGRDHNLAGIAEGINSDTGPRIWHPTLGLINWPGFS